MTFPMHLAIALSGVLAAAPLSLAQHAASPTPPVTVKASEDPLLAADLALLARLDQPFASPKTFKDATAREIVDAVRNATGVLVEVDRRVKGDAGGWEFVRLDCQATTPRQALDAVAAALSDAVNSLKVDVAAGLLMFTNAESDGRLAAVRHYDMRPLLMRRDPRDESTDWSMQSLEDYLTETVDPETWRDNGGDGGWIRSLDTTLVINASPARHHAIIKTLAALEASLPSSTILWQVRVVEISNEVPPQDLRIVLNSGSELDALIATNGAKLVSAPRIVSPRFDRASMKVGSNTDTIEVAIEPVDGSMAFSVEVRETRIGVTRSLSLLALDGIRSAAILESNGKRLLVEVLGGGVAGGGVPADAKTNATTPEPANAP